MRNKLQDVKDIYQQALEKMLADSNVWKEFLQYAGHMYKYDFPTLVTAFEQNKGYTQLATYDGWKSVGRQVRKGEKSTPVLIKHQRGILHLFDVSQLHEQAKPWIWELTEEDREVFVERFIQKNAAYQNEYMKTFEEIRCNMIVEGIKSAAKQAHDPKVINTLLSKYLYESIEYMVQYRCNMIADDTAKYFQSLSEVEHDTLPIIGYYGIRIAREILLNSKEIVMELRKEKLYEQTQDRGIAKRDGDGIRIQRRDGSMVGSREGNGGGVRQTFEQVRQSSSGILGRAETDTASGIDYQRNTDGDDAQDSNESGGKNGTFTRGDVGEGSDTEPRQLSLNLATQTENSRSGRGNHTERNRIQLELNISTANQNTPLVNGISNPNEVRHSYRYKEEHHVGGGLRTLYKQNVEAIQTLKVIEKENRLATREEQVILSRYSGWGGLSLAFDPNKQAWAKQYKELQEILEPDEYNSARASTLTAFYTPPELIQGIYQALEQFGFQGGNILDPAMGTGRFFSHIPNSMEHSKLYGVEIDSISARIAKQLYQEANIQIRGYEETDFSDNFFDVAISNIPFGDVKVYDKRYQKHNFLIHDYFFAKTIDKVRAGGIIAFITSKGTLDKSNPMVRKYIAERTELIGAIRLPNIAFKTMNTEVTSDIIFLQKRDRIQVVEPDWMGLGYTEDNVPVNQYFINHPKMMLGNMQFDTKMFGEDSKYTTLVCDTPEKYPTLYREAIQDLSAKYIDQKKEKDEKEEDISLSKSIPADPNVKNYCYTLFEDQIYYRENAVMNLVSLSDKKQNQMKSLLQIRQATREIIEAQLHNCSDEKLIALQERLTLLYDDHMQVYGFLTNGSNGLFQADSDYPLLLSLEHKDKQGTVRKADIFTKRTIIPYRNIEYVETSKEGLAVSLVEKGKVDIPYSAKLANKMPDELVSDLKGLIYLNPSRYNQELPYEGYETEDEYLSGNVRVKLKIAKVLAEKNPIFEENVVALQKVQPEDLSASDIEIRLGTTWIKEEDYTQFLYELLETPLEYQRRPYTSTSSTKTEVKYNSFTSSYGITNQIYGVTNRIRATETYGTKRMNAYAIIESSLNLKTVVVKDRLINAEGNYYYVVNKKETILAREKQSIIKQKFKEWFWKDINRREKYVSKYNELFNNSRLRSYDGSRLTFPGMNPEITLRPYQKDAIARMLFGGSTLLAHCVGAGKTFEMIAAAMEMKRIGLSNKAIFCVPNHLTEQIGSDFIKLYPGANLLVAKKTDFEPLNRKTFINRMATGEYDAIILGHTQFEKIPISPERKERIIKEQIEQVKASIERIKAEHGENWSIKQMEAFKKGLETELKSLMDSKKDNTLYFEDLGVDTLFVDEAHYYKNCAVFSKMRNVAGISTSKAKKSTDMLAKCQYLQEKNKGRGVIFATGTPISNSMTELFVIQRYLQYDKLKERGLEHFDAWASNFGEVVSSLELAPEGTGYRFKNRFAKFTNLPELMSMFREVADVQLPEMLNLPVPKIKGGAYKVIVAEPCEYVKQAMKLFVKRAEAVRDGKVHPTLDNMLKITNEARILGTDPRLLNPSAPNNPAGKLQQCIECTYMEYRESTSIKGVQIIFSDVGTPSKERWSLYDYIKEELIKLGVPKEEICFIHDANTEKQKEQLFEDLRKGVKRIIIGSTAKMGTGTNIQDRIVAIHDLDAPWRPADLEQRGGRGFRYGNMNAEVSAYRYVTKDTFDAYNWQLLEQKQSFISQIMSNKFIGRTCEDVDETVLSYAEIKALATGNPYIKEKMDIDTEVSRIQMLKAGFLNEKYKYEEGYLRIYPKQIQEYSDRIEHLEKDIQLRDNNPIYDNTFKIQLQGVAITERSKAGEILMATMSMDSIPDHIGEFRGFSLHLCFSESNQRINRILIKGVGNYTVDMGLSGLGNIARLENMLKEFDNELEYLKEKLSIVHDNLKEAKSNSNKVFPYEKELQDKMSRQIELNQILELEKNIEVMADESTDMESNREVMEEYYNQVQEQYNDLEYER